MIIRHHRTGFTLLELTVATSLFAFFLTIVIIGVVNVTQVFEKASTTQATQTTARNIIEEIRREAEFADRVYLVKLEDDGGSPTHLLQSPNHTQGQVYGLCIERSSIGQIMYYIDYAKLDISNNPTDFSPTDVPSTPGQKQVAAYEIRNLDPTIPAYTSGSDDDVIATAQANHSLANEVDNNSPYFFSTKRVYKSFSCSNPYDNRTTVGNTGNGSFGDTNVQFLRFRTTVTGRTTRYPDRIPVTSIIISLVVTQKGPPALATEPARNPAHQFDDTIAISTAITPTVSSQ